MMGLRDNAPAVVVSEKTRIQPAGYFMLFETRKDAEKVARSFGAEVIEVPINVILPDVTPKKDES